MIPLLHDFEDERVLVFGGGPVGARKARRFASEADVIVVSPAFADREFGDVMLVRAAPEPADVPEWIDRVDPKLVVAATDNEAVNDAAAAATAKTELLLNRTDQSGSDRDGVVVPATVRDDPVVVSISTGGNSPALSKSLRQQFEDDLDGAGAMATLTGSLRTELKAEGVDPAQRREAIRAVVESPRVWKALRRGNSNPRQVAADEIDSVLHNDS